MLVDALDPSPVVLRILERLDFWRLPADAPVDEIVETLVATPITREPLDGTCLAAAGYDAATTVLELEFVGKRPRLHRYLGVPEPLYRELRAAKSKGRFYRGRVYARFVGARMGVA